MKEKGENIVVGAGMAISNNRNGQRVQNWIILILG